MKKAMQLSGFAILFCLLVTFTATSDVNKYTVKFTLTFEDCTLEQAAKIEKDLIEKYKDVDVSIENKLVDHREPSLWRNYMIPDNYIPRDSVFFFENNSDTIKFK